MDSINLNCDYIEADPRPQITWYFNDTQINIENAKKFKVESNYLFIKKMTSKDKGFYKCILSNGFFQDKSLLYYVNVSGK